MNCEVGLRVVRGPDWRWANQDNGEGHLGVIVEIGKTGSSSSPDKTVVVQWDCGSRTNYRVGYQDSYDLRLFDNGPAGVKHPNVICDGCKVHGISGMLWKCLKCKDFDLCTTCYMNDTHELTHPFLRFDTPNCQGVELSPRHESPKVVSKGIFAGARVVRGPDWDWGNQDGLEGKIGRVIDIRGWDNESGRSVANVVWASGNTNVYRLGHKGKVDIKCVQSSSAGSYYVQHLPLVGLPSLINQRSTIPNSSTQNAGSRISTSSSSTTTTVATPSSSTISPTLLGQPPQPMQYSFNVGDKVQVIVNFDELKVLQEGHGGLNPRMADYIRKMGSVHRVTDKGDIRVQYENNIRWTFNPNCISKVNSYSVGDIVEVLSDMSKVKALQQGHGEWVDIMNEILGKRGRILKIYSDSDLRINFENTDWTMNPLCVNLVTSSVGDKFESNNSMYATTYQRRDESTSQDPMVAHLPKLLEQQLTISSSSTGSSDSSTHTVERLIREAAQGRTENVKKMIGKLKDRLNHKSSGKTPLQVSAHQGHVDIVLLLIGAGANLEIADDEGDTSLHYSSFGNQSAVMEILLKAGALVNAINRGQCTPLHVAVNKQFLDCVKILLKFKCNVNIQDSYGDTALHDAIGKENKEIIDALINTNGVDFTLRNNRGFNVFHHAALKGNGYALQSLISKSRQLIDVKKDDGFSALHLAALNGHFFVSKILVEKGAEIDIRNNRKQTPLLLAASQGYVGICEYLVGKGSSISAEDEEGDSLLHIIFQKHFEPPNSNSNPPVVAQSQSTNTNTPIAKEELRKLDNAPLNSDVCGHLINLGWSETDEDLGGSMLACFMVRAGCSLSKRNRHGVCPLDLVKTERLKEALKIYQRLRSTYNNNSSSSNSNSSTTTIVQNSDRPKDTTSPNPSTIVLSTTPILPAECIICTELTVDFVTFEPCGHQSVCTECSIRMKKCITCQAVITKKVARVNRSSSNSSSNNFSCNNTPSDRDRLKYLENKFAEIEETYCCSICMERRRNVAFLCGHGSCSVCSESLVLCHMCRLPISQKINLY